MTASQRFAVSSPAMRDSPLPSLGPCLFSKIMQHLGGGGQKQFGLTLRYYKNSICVGILEIIFFKICECGLVCAHWQKAPFIIVTTIAIFYLL